MKKLQKDKISVGIIGLGNIGMLLDIGSHTNTFNTHLKAFYYSRKFEIEFVLDNDFKKLEIAKKNYPGVKNLYVNVKQIESFPSLIVLCASELSNIYYFNLLKDNKDIKNFFVEKPFRLESKEDYLKYNNKIIINYYRKFTPFYNNIKKQVCSDNFGNLKSITVRFSKGIYNSLTHFIDLIFFLFGNTLTFKDIVSLDKISHIGHNDFSYSFVFKDINIYGAHAYFNSIDYNDLYVIDIELYFENVKLEIKNYETEYIYYEKKLDVNFEKYFDYKVTKRNKINNTYYMKYVVDFLPSLLDRNIPTEFSISQDKQVLETIDKIKNKKYE